MGKMKRNQQGMVLHLQDRSCGEPSHGKLEGTRTRGDHERAVAEGGVGGWEVAVAFSLEISHKVVSPLPIGKELEQLMFCQLSPPTLLFSAGTHSGLGWA